MNEPRRFKHWDDWQELTWQWCITPFLKNCSEYKQDNILSAFAVGVRQGHYRCSYQTLHSLDALICSIGQTIKMVWGHNPSKIHDDCERIIQLHRLLEAYQ